MAIYSYVVEHDVGFAPNPFYGACTLAACKPVIRQNAQIGDFVLGFGSAKHGYAGLLVYWMEIDEIITFNEYWQSPRFQEKKPVMNGSLMKVYGDNIYYRPPGSEVFEQAFSFHSKSDGTPDLANLKRDTGRTDRVAIATNFLYLGRNAISLPAHLQTLEKYGRGHKVCRDAAMITSFRTWIATSNRRGYYGRPIDWPPISKRGR